MTLLFTSKRFLDHETGAHPERPQRLIQVHRHLERVGLAARCEIPQWQPATDVELTRVHQPGYLPWLRDYCLRGGGRVEADTVVCPASAEVAEYAAGAVCEAVRRVLAGPQRQALCLVRPPGHHALAGEVMGFCLYNNVAIGARAALDEGRLSRVMIVDWDVHHGNGTQDTFWHDPQVAFFSAHRWPFYPGTGRAEETGSGPGLGLTRNLPCPMGIARSLYLDRVRAELEQFASRHPPELILISAGFDAHRDDPVGSLGLEVEDFAQLTEIVLDVAEAFSGGRVVSVLEGGYNPGILAACVEAHLATLLDRDPATPAA
ncbi:MAG: histone deacetylase [Pirellulales bacterium]|nr:histone deacetylase [Pirellulales bacterium]